MRIAILEDDPDQARLVQTWLEADAHHCHTFATAESFRKNLSAESYDLLILDWELPSSSGLEVLSWFRQTRGWDIPVLFTTVRDSEDDVVMALENGADDYINKPLSRAVTIARVNALARRFHGAPEEEERQYEEFTINTRQGHISRHGEAIDMTDREFKLALMLFENTDQIVSRGHILENIWGITADVHTRTIDTHISRIRQKLQLVPENGWKIRAVYQHGYRLERLNEAE